MKIIKKSFFSGRECDLEGCKHFGCELYFIEDLTKEEYEHLKLNRLMKKTWVALAYDVNSFWVKLCPKHYVEILKKQKDYVAWCLI